MFLTPQTELTVHRRDEARLIDAGTPPGAEDRPYVGRPFRSRQLFFLAVLVVMALMTLAGRAAQLQLYHGGEYRALADGNRIRTHVLLAPRGIIYDQFGRPLTENSPELSLALFPFDLPTSDDERRRLFAEVSEASGAPVALFEDAWQAANARQRRRIDPVLLDYDLPMNQGLKLQVLSRQWLGVRVVTIPRRRIPDDAPASLSHVLGYVGRVTDADLQENSPYVSQDIIGKQGIERSYEEVLKGTNGERLMEVNALGEEQLQYAETPAVAGRHVWLTIDAELQAIAEAALVKQLDRAKVRRGSVVVEDPNDGSILALVSWPPFSANAFSEGIGQDAYTALLNDPDRPLFPRASAGTYPSGSTIKPVVAAAALADSIVTASTTFLSSGGIRVGQWFFPDWKAGGHGQTDVRKALAESVNTFFYIVGGGYGDVRGLGIDRLGYWATRFGLGSPTGIDLPGEAAGFFPTPGWKEEVKDEVWYIGDTYHASIGQGDVLVTPLQVANFTSAIANGGTLPKPRLVKEIAVGDGEPFVQAPDVIREEVAPAAVLAVVRQGMRQAVVAGSARFLGDLPIATAGKTGTAEVGGDATPHAWFTGFSPYDDPKLVVTVLVENAGEGSSFAVPVAKDIFQWWAERRLE